MAKQHDKQFKLDAIQYAKIIRSLACVAAPIT